MSEKYKVLARTVSTTEIGELAGPPAELPAQLRELLAAAGKDGRLDRLSTRPGLPAIAVQAIGDGPGLGEGPEVMATALFGASGQALGGRDYRATPTPDGNGVLVEITGGDGEFTPLGVIVDPEVAMMVGQFWRNGFLD